MVNGAVDFSFEKVLFFLQDLLSSVFGMKKFLDGGLLQLMGFAKFFQVHFAVIWLVGDGMFKAGLVELLLSGEGGVNFGFFPEVIGLGFLFGDGDERGVKLMVFF
jgi:hypothetical protein